MTRNSADWFCLACCLFAAKVVFAQATSTDICPIDQVKLAKINADLKGTSAVDQVAAMTAAETMDLLYGTPCILPLTSALWEVMYKNGYEQPHSSANGTIGGRALRLVEKYNLGFDMNHPTSNEAYFDAILVAFKESPLSDSQSPDFALKYATCRWLLDYSARSATHENLEALAVVELAELPIDLAAADAAGVMNGAPSWEVDCVTKTLPNLAKKLPDKEDSILSFLQGATVGAAGIHIRSSRNDAIAALASEGPKGLTMIFNEAIANIPARQDDLIWESAVELAINKLSSLGPIDDATRAQLEKSAIDAAILALAMPECEGGNVTTPMVDALGKRASRAIPAIQARAILPSCPADQAVQRQALARLQ